MNRACLICAHVTRERSCPECRKHGVIAMTLPMKDLVSRFNRYQAGRTRIMAAIDALSMAGSGTHQ